MRLLAIALFAVLVCSPAVAQNCTGLPSANTICAGPTSGGAGTAKFRALVAADLSPVFVTCSAHQFVNVISASGSTCAQPAFSDLSGQIAIGQIPNTTVTPGSYGDATHISTFTVDQQGRLTAAGTAAVTSVAGCNVRPTNETSYTVLSTDNDGCVVVTNITAIETVTLPSAAANPKFRVVVAMLPGPNSASALPARVTAASGNISNQVVVDVAPYGSGTYTSDGTNWNQTVDTIASLNGGAGFTMPSSVSYSPATLPLAVTVSGTCTLNDVVGFDYASSLFATQHFRHTMATGPTCLQDAVNDLMAQFKANTTVKSAIGADIVNASNTLQTSATSWSYAFNQSWPFIVNNPPTTTPFCSPCSTETVTGGGAGSPNLEVGAAFLLGRSMLSQGRTPLANDRLGGFYWCGDTTSVACFPHFGTPFYGQIQATVINPSPAAQTASLTVAFNTVGFTNSAATGVGYGGVGIGTSNPASLFHMFGADGTITTQTIDAFANNGTINFKRADTGSASPSALGNNEFIGSFGSSGYNGTTYKAGAAIGFETTQAYTGSVNGTGVVFFTTANGSSAEVEAMRLTSGLCVGCTADPGVGVAKLKPQTFASLTACSATIEGAMASVTDSNTAVWGANIAGAGANHVLGYCDGTAWTVAGK